VGLGLGGDPVAAGLGADPAEQVVAGRRQQGGQDQGAEQPAEHRPLEGQLEDVEADVATELGVGGVERHRVAPQQEALPQAGGLQAGHQPEEGGHADAQGPQVRAEDGAVTVDLGAPDHGQAVAG
jgi:hypothetical protein